MTKNIFRNINFSLMMVSISFLFMFLWLSDNCKDNVILWIFLPLLAVNLIYMTYQFIKDKSSFPDEVINFEFIFSVFKTSWEVDRSSVINIFLQEFCFIMLIYLYNYGYLIIPFCIFTLTNFVQSFVEKTDKKRIDFN